MDGDAKLATVPREGPLAHGYVDVERMDWETMPLPGAERKLLYEDKENQRSTVLFRTQPGCVISFHEHPEIEQTYVLKGRLVDEYGECTAGNFVWRGPGSRHEAHTPEGAEFLVFFMKPPRRLEKPKG